MCDVAWARRTGLGRSSASWTARTTVCTCEVRPCDGPCLPISPTNWEVPRVRSVDARAGALLASGRLAGAARRPVGLRGGDHDRRDGARRRRRGPLDGDRGPEPRPGHREPRTHRRSRADRWVGSAAATGSGSSRSPAGTSSRWSVHGARTSLLIGLAATVVSVLLGVLIGAAAAYLGGWWDRVITWVGDVIFGFPYLIFMIALSAVAPASCPKPLLLIIVIGFFGWPRVARIVRSQTLSLRGRDVRRGRPGDGRGPVARVHPASCCPTCGRRSSSSRRCPSRRTIGLEAALSFLGVGIPPPTPSWGRSIGDAIDWVADRPDVPDLPGRRAVPRALAFNVLGDGLRDALDPRSAAQPVAGA